MKKKEEKAEIKPIYCPRCQSSMFKNNSSRNCPDCKELRGKTK
jgi:transposase-like protein